MPANPTRPPPRGAPRAAPQRVRLIGGRWRRSLLPVVDAPGLRPTPDRVRETLFNWLGQDLTGLVCADLFAGTGALGLEAASRGAAAVHLAETAPAARRALQAAIDRLGAAEQVRLHGSDALGLLQRLRAAGERLDLVFVDPPFHQGLLASVLPALAPLLNPASAWVYVESEAALDDAQVRAWLGPDARIARQATAGQVHYHLLAIQPPSQETP
ncbi:MAG: 16S rRNA (guanine(966)-N(2))-methyltransferase RsmD [Burkholderiales bacterium]